MKQPKLIRIGALTAIVLSFTSFQNCANKQFSDIAQNQKFDKLAQESVFPPGSGEIPGAGDGSGQIPTTGGNGSGQLPTDGNNGNGQIGTTNPGSGTLATGGSGGGGEIPGSNGNNNGGSILNGNTTTATGGFGSGGQSALPGMNGNVNVTTGSTGTPASVTLPSGILGGGVNGDIPLNNMPVPFSGNQVRVAFVCSDFRSDANGNLATSPVVKVQLIGADNQVKCDFTSNTLRDFIVQNKAFDMALLDVGCPNLPAGKYALRLQNPNKTPGRKDLLLDGSNTNLVIGDQNKKGFVIQKSAQGWNRSDVRMNVLTDRNPTKDADGLNNMTMLTNKSQCDALQSPLVVHLNSNPNKAEHLVLSSPQNGVFFDILGKNSFPSAHTPKKISWHRTLNYLYIVLPDANGQVKGIDQMFGNNTMGPDGKFALNGYEALGKFDGKDATGTKVVGAADGFINSKDPIYFALKLWRDENYDGVAQANELYSLAGAGITTIDLHYNPSYFERDKYGNETRYKSVVQTRDGKLHLMFDLWFNVEN